MLLPSVLNKQLSSLGLLVCKAQVVELAAVVLKPTRLSVCIVLKLLIAFRFATWRNFRLKIVFSVLCFHMYLFVYLALLEDLNQHLLWILIDIRGCKTLYSRP